MTIFVDADGCPVKDEVYRVARRYSLPVTLVANSWFRHPADELFTVELVGNDLDAADDFIAEHATAHDIVITGDIPLASRCLKKGAAVLDHRGGRFTEERIGHALAGRELMSQLRSMGEVGGGPAPFSKRASSQFLQRLDETVHAVRAKIHREERDK